MPPLDTRTRTNGNGYVPQGEVRRSEAQPVATPRVDARNNDGMADVRPAAPDAGQAAASPRRTIGQRLGGLAKGLLKGAAVIGLAAGLIVGGGYVMKDVAPQFLNQIEAPAVPGSVQDQGLPNSQAPPVEIDPGSDVHKTPLPTQGGTQGTGGSTAPGQLPTAPGTTPGTTDPAKPDLNDRTPVIRDNTIPSDGGQTPAGLRDRTPISGTIQSPAHGIPGLTEEVKPDAEPSGPNLDGFKPSLGDSTTGKPPMSRIPLPALQLDPVEVPGATTDSAKPILNNGGTTDSGKPVLGKPQLVKPGQIDGTQTFKPHMLRGQ